MSKKAEKITVESLLKRKEELLGREPNIAEFYVESLGGTVTIKEPSTSLLADVRDMESDMANKYVLYECMTEPNVKCDEVQEAFGRPTFAADILDNILKPGEIAHLSGECVNLAGFGADSVQNIKN